jgi:hypothetical protein
MAGYRYAVGAVLLVAITALQGCAFGTQLQTSAADPKTISGTYDLYLYGCRYPADWEHAAFLISADARYPVNLFVTDTSYKVTKAVPAEKALSEAEKFVRCGIYSIESTRVRRIPDDSGGTIGYEILPRYAAHEQAGTDPLLVSYSLKDGKVTVMIQLSSFAKQKLGGRGSGSSGMGR